MPNLEETEDALASSKAPANPAQEADQVEALDRMMGQLLALKEQGGDMPLAQRKRLAARFPAFCKYRSQLMVPVPATTSDYPTTLIS